ncbi:hypothetical protein L1887_43632 [Cichorium endivia]|nr:hypothetical protein L1887_43632 [Cichorium endivia]
MSHPEYTVLALLSRGGWRGHWRTKRSTNGRTSLAVSERLVTRANDSMYMSFGEGNPQDLLQKVGQWDQLAHCTVGGAYSEEVDSCYNGNARAWPVHEYHICEYSFCIPWSHKWEECDGVDAESHAVRRGEGCGEEALMHVSCAWELDRSHTLIPSELAFELPGLVQAELVAGRDEVDAAWVATRRECGYKLQQLGCMSSRTQKHPHRTSILLCTRSWHCWVGVAAGRMHQIRSTTRSDRESRTSSVRIEGRGGTRYSSTLGGSTWLIGWRRCCLAASKPLATESIVPIVVQNVEPEQGWSRCPGVRAVLQGPLLGRLAELRSAKFYAVVE